MPGFAWAMDLQGERHVVARGCAVRGGRFWHCASGWFRTVLDSEKGEDGGCGIFRRLVFEVKRRGLRTGYAGTAVLQGNRRQPAVGSRACPGMLRLFGDVLGELQQSYLARMIFYSDEGILSNRRVRLAPRPPRSCTTLKDIP